MEFHDSRNSGIPGNPWNHAVSRPSRNSAYQQVRRRNSTTRGIPEFQENPLKPRPFRRGIPEFQKPPETKPFPGPRPPPAVRGGIYIPPRTAGGGRGPGNGLVSGGFWNSGIPRRKGRGFRGFSWNSGIPRVVEFRRRTCWYAEFREGLETAWFQGFPGIPEFRESWNSKYPVEVPFVK